jgi:hypothetical protein
MIDEQKLKDALSVLMDPVGVGDDHQPFGRRERAGGLRLGEHPHRPVWPLGAHLHQAHSAHSHRFETRMVAEDWNVKTHPLDRFHNHLTLGNLKGDPVYGDVYGLNVSYGCHKVRKKANRSSLLAFFLSIQSCHLILLIVEG